MADLAGDRQTGEALENGAPDADAWRIELPGDTTLDIFPVRYLARHRLSYSSHGFAACDRVFERAVLPNLTGTSLSRGGDRSRPWRSDQRRKHVRHFSGKDTDASSQIMESFVLIFYFFAIG